MQLRLRLLHSSWKMQPWNAHVHDDARMQRRIVAAAIAPASGIEHPRRALEMQHSCSCSSHCCCRGFGPSRRGLFAVQQGRELRAQRDVPRGSAAAAVAGVVRAGNSGVGRSVRAVLSVCRCVHSRCALRCARARTAAAARAERDRPTALTDSGSPSAVQRASTMHCMRKGQR